MANSRLGIEVVMGLKDDELKRGLKEIPQEIKRAKLEHFVKLKLDTSDFRYEAQKGIKEAIRDAQKANAMSYVNGKGKNVNVDPFSFKSLTDAIVHFQKEGVEKAAKAVQRLRAEMYLLGQDYKETNAIAKNKLGLNTRLEAAANSGKVQAARQKAARDAYRELTKDEREQRQADELYRRRYGAFAAEQTKYEKEQAARAAKLQAEADKRASDNLRSYDKRVEKGSDTLTPELNQLRQMYLGGRSRFVNGSNGNAGLSDFIKKQRESLKSDLAIANGLRQIQGGGYVEDFRRLNNQFAANSQIGKLLRQQGRKPMDAAFMGYINNFGKPINSELAQLNAYYAELEKTSAKSAKKMQDDAKRTAKEYGKISAAVRKLDSHMNKMSSGKGNSNPMLARMRSYYAELEKSSAKSAQQAQRAAIAQENAQNRVVRQYQQQYGILGGLKSRLASYMSIYAVANFGKKVAETTGYFEKQQVALEGILGSASKAQTILSQIKNFALQSPFQTKELVNFTKQLSAFSIPADELFDTTKRLADISAGLGVDMSSIILAYGQVRSAAVLRGQELRQFTEAGIPLVQKLAEKFTQLRGEVVTTADVFELISKRQVSFQMVSDVLADMTKEGGQFYKMQENITNTLYGQMQKLQDMWTIELDKLGKGGNNNFLMGVVKLLQLIIQNTKGVSAALISAFTLNWAISGVRKMRMEWELMDVQVKKNIGSLKKFQMLRLKAFAGNLGWGIAAAGVGLAFGAIVEHLRKLKEVENRMAEISASFNKETNKMIGGFDDLVKRLRGAKEGTQAYNDAIETLKSNYGEFVNVNQETIATLLSEQKSIDGNITEYQKLRDEIAAAIKLKQEFNELKTKKETLSGIVTSNAEGSQFWGTGYKASNQAALTMFANILSAGGNQAQRGDALNSLFGTNYESTSAYSKLLDDLNKVSNETYTEFTSKGLKYKGDFQELFKRNFENQFMLNNFATSPDSSISNWVTNISSTMFAKMAQEQGWKDYVEAVDKLAGKGTDLLSSMIRINNEFDKFNPGENDGVGAVGRQNWQNTKYIELLSNVTSEFEKLGGNADKLKELRDVIAKNDPNSIKDITDAIDEFLKTITDPKRREVVSDAKKRFVSGTEALTAQEEEIAERMSKDATWAGINRGEINGVKIQSVIDNYNPAGLGEQTVQQTRDKLRSAYDDLRKELKTYTKNAELFKDDIALINTKMRVIERLAKSDLYAVDLTEKNGGGGAREYDAELRDFMTNLKDAYEVYKRAAQAEGADMGLAYMRNDKKMQERFFNYFHGNNSGGPNGKFDIFKNENGKEITIGKAGPKLRDILGEEGMYIESGLEAGVIDFEKAFRRIAKALKDYARADEKNRRQFMNMGDAYERIADQISKDNVAAWIKEMNKQFADLGKTFERTSQQVELYRGLMRNGTAGQLGRYAGVGSGTAMTPDSVRNAGNIKQMMALYNKLLKEEASKNLKEGETLDESKLHYLSIDKLGSVGDIQQAITTVTERMKLNKDNFGLGTFGEAGTKLEALLQNQLGIIIKELQSISSEQYTGDNLADAIANAQTKVKTAIDITRSQEMVNKLYGGDHGAAMKGRMDATFAAMQSIFDEFLKSNNFEAMSQATRFFTNKDGSQSSTEIWGAAGIDIEKLKEKFRKIVDNVDDNILKDELEKKFRDLELKVLEFNAAGGDLGAIHDNIQLYKGAHDEAVNRYNTYTQKRYRLMNEVASAEADVDMAEGTNISKEEYEALVNRALALRDELSACNTELTKMGENGINFEKSLKGDALKNIQASIGKASQGLNVMQDAVMGVINAASSLAKAVNKVYDVMNDGENPAWMQDMEGFLEDFGEAFQMLIAPIGAVIAMITALAIVSVTAEAMMTPLLIVMLAIIAAAVIVAAIVAAFQQHDRELQRDIENLEKHIEETERAMKNLEAASKRMNGYSKWNTELQALSKNYDIYTDRLKQAQKEEEKKNTDPEKVKEFEQGARESLDEFLNSLKDSTDAIMGSVQDWSSSLSNALRSAFQNGENAARAFRNTAIEMVGDIVNKIIEMQVLEPMMEEAVHNLLGYSLDEEDADYIGNQDKFKNEDGSVNSKALADYVTGKLSNDNAEGIYDFMRAVETGYGSVIDFINNDLATPLKEAWAYNSETSALSGGIQGITEDTARTLEGLSNSMLAQLVLIQRSSVNMEGFAQMQVNQFKSLLSIQGKIRDCAESISNSIDQMRNGIRPLSVSMPRT